MCDHGEDLSAFYSALPRLVIWLFRAPLWVCVMFLALTLLLALEIRPASALPTGMDWLLRAPLCFWLMPSTFTLDSALPSKPPLALPMYIFCELRAPDCCIIYNY